MSKITVKYLPSEDTGVITTHDFKTFRAWFPDSVTRAILSAMQTQLGKE